MKNFKKAFSLIELSVIVAIVGFFVVIITGSSKLIDVVKNINISSIPSEKLNSMVKGMGGLEVWYETSTKESFDTKNPSSGQSITKWNNSASNSNHATSTTSGSYSYGFITDAPKYSSQSINNVPALSFDNNSLLYFNLFNVASQSDYTMFIVEKNNITNISGQISTLLSHNPPRFYWGYVSASAGIIMGKGDANSWYFDTYNSLGGNPAHQKGIPKIWSATNSGVGALYINGTKLALHNSNGNIFLNNITTPHPNATIGGMRGSGDEAFYEGDIAEVIVFNRKLSDLQRHEVESYLSEKFNIDVVQE